MNGTCTTESRANGTEKQRITENCGYPTSSSSSSYLIVQSFSPGNGNTNFAEYSGWTAVSIQWYKVMVWVVIT